MVFEGGAFVTDGLSTIITTKECVLDNRRNPEMSEGEVKSTFMIAELWALSWKLRRLN